MTQICGVTASACRCHKPPHDPEDPHVCGETASLWGAVEGGPCGGSWFGDGTDDPDFVVVSYPLIG